MQTLSERLLCEKRGGAAARKMRAAAPFVFISAGFMRDISLQIQPESRKKTLRSI